MKVIPAICAPRAAPLVDAAFPRSIRSVGLNAFVSGGCEAEMLGVDEMEKIRRARFREGRSIKGISRDQDVLRATVVACR